MATSAVSSSPVLLQSHSSLVRESIPSPPSIKVTSAYPTAKPASSNSRPNTPSRAAAAKRENPSPTPPVEKDWPDTESLYEEVLDDCEPFEYSNAPGEVTAQEAEIYRSRLHDIGPDAFIKETISQDAISAKKLLSVFGVKIPVFLLDQPDETCYPLLGLAIQRELSKRRRLKQYQTIDDAAALLKSSKRVIVITGAGISTSLGIPDFRSKDTGFYTKLLEMGFKEPESVFDLETFDDDPTTFYSLAGDILPDLHKWTPTHQFIKILQDQHRLLRNYTQNIDNVEANAGLRAEKLVQCHGSWATATCRKCRYQAPGESIFDDIRAQKVSECPRCTEELRVPRPGIKRKRSTNSTRGKRRPGSDDDDDIDDDIPQPGVMKPDITFFGEPLPPRFFDILRDHDVHNVDLVIVMGTSMKVAPVSEVPNIIPRDVPQMYISRDPVHHINFDINLLGDCDTIVAELCRRAGWELKHDMAPKEQIVNVQSFNEQPNVFAVTVATPVEAEVVVTKAENVHA